MRFNYQYAFFVILTILLSILLFIGINYSINYFKQDSYNQGVTDAQNYTYNYLVQSAISCTPIKIPFIYENQSINLNFYYEGCIKQGSNGQ